MIIDETEFNEVFDDFHELLTCTIYHEVILPSGRLELNAHTKDDFIGGVRPPISLGNGKFLYDNNGLRVQDWEELHTSYDIIDMSSTIYNPRTNFSYKLYGKLKRFGFFKYYLGKI